MPGSRDPERGTAALQKHKIRLLARLASVIFSSIGIACFGWALKAHENIYSDGVDGGLVASVLGCV